MKKRMLLFACLLFAPIIANGQMVINNFDVLPDSVYFDVYDGGAKTYVNLSLETTQVHGGTGALKVDWQNRCYDQWGGWIGMQHWHPDSLGFYDFSPYTDISFWYYIENPCSKPGAVTFRIILNDFGPGTPEGSWGAWITHLYILGSEPGWNKVTVPMEDNGLQWSGGGFHNPGWGGKADGNGILDLDKIRGWWFEFSFDDVSVYQTEDDTAYGTIILDDLMLEGVAPINLVFFNGKAVPSNVNMHVGWSGSVIVTDEEAFTPGTNSVKWVTGSWWDGVEFDLDNPMNLQYNWSTDSVKLKIKAEAGIGDLRLIFSDPDEDGDINDSTDFAFEAVYLLTEADVGFDGTWKQVKVALKDFNRYSGIWCEPFGTVIGPFDSSKVFDFRIGGSGQSENWGTTNYTVYLDDIWTGNPEFDYVKPIAVTGVGGVPARAIASNFQTGYFLYTSDQPPP